ncbi:MAG: amylo-alpha-1,6-glucosidase [Candidatus Nanohaloarchaea archaeon]
MVIRQAGGKTGTVSNLDCFLHRHLDSGFRTKWDGLWSPPYKYLDYFAARVNGTWLSPENRVETEYGDMMAFRHEAGDLEVEESVRACGDSAGIEISYHVSNKSGEPKAIHLSLETGIDIREKSEDLGPREYELEETEDGFRAEHGGKRVSVTGGEPETDATIKEHYPGERQVCLVPGELTRKVELEGNESETIRFRIETEKDCHGKLETREQASEGLFDGSFHDCVKSTCNLIYRVNGTGVIAGHPWFQSYWARDSFWTALGLVDAGRYEEVRRMLEKFAREGLPGKIGHSAAAESRERSDTYPLYVIAARKLQRHHEISEEIEKGCSKAMDRLEVDETGIVKHPGEGTWMDTLERAPAVDVQSLWLKACRLQEDERAEDLEKGLERFLGEEWIRDQARDEGPRTINGAVPLMFGHIDAERAERYLSTMNAEFVSQYGARTRSAVDPGYDASGYHTGSTWGLTTCWAAAANAEYGKTERAIKTLEKMGGLMETDQPGSLPEVVDSETGDLLGCPEQAWSSGLFVHVVDSYILGIGTGEEKPSVEPSGPVKATRRGKRYGKEVLDIRIEGKEAQVLNRRSLNR